MTLRLDPKTEETEEKQVLPDFFCLGAEGEKTQHVRKNKLYVDVVFAKMNHTSSVFLYTIHPLFFWKICIHRHGELFCVSIHLTIYLSI